MTTNIISNIARHTKRAAHMALAITAAATLASCGDFFDPDTDDKLNGSDYISSNTEMYTGFLGIMTKLQAIGDKEILLTDTRAGLLEPTEQSIPELIALYNYDTDLKDNPYANPAGYYEVIIACNDYIAKMKEYAANPQVDQDIYRDLVSSTARIKVWTYKTMGEIYGKAVWFDDPLVKVSSINNPDKFTMMDMAGITDKCLQLMDNGIDGVPLNRNIDWIAWLDPSNITNIAGSQYRKWNYMIPPYEGLLAELCLWKGAALNAAGTDATTYYKRAADALLSALGTYINNESFSGNSPYWMPCATTPGHYSTFWNNDQPYPAETVAALIYDYTNSQTNSLLYHFSAEYPNKYLLRPSEAGRAQFYDPDFNPGGAEGDARSNCLFKQCPEGYYIGKFRAAGSSVRVNAYQDDVHIYIYRQTQYHMLLAEALNNLGRYSALNAVLNTGVKTSEYSADNAEWEGFTQNWTSSAEWGSRKYPSMGIRGALNLNARQITLPGGADRITEQQARRLNDEAVLNETMLEFACEGKVYASMNRMAMRYNDLSIVADRVCGKYPQAAQAATVRQRIMDGGNWVPYNY